MTRICPNCGALLLTRAANCSFCDVAGELQPGSPRIARTSSSVKVGGKSEWQSEVTRRLGDYRARRQSVQAEETQAGLPFRAPRTIPETAPERPRPRPAATQPPRKMERLEICVQPEFDFSNSPHDRAHPQTALVPVAGLGPRRLAAALDAFFIALTSAGFLALFHALGGQIGFARTDLIIYTAVIFLFYAKYFFLFTTLGGTTPGMQLSGLSCVRLDGSLPDNKQLLRRSFGYALSGAALLFGFFWALWDEDHFTWQDRISQTYLTAAPPLAEAAPVEVRGKRVPLHL